MTTQEKARNFIGYLDSGIYRQECDFLLMALAVSFCIPTDEVVRRIRELAK